MNQFNLEDEYAIIQGSTLDWLRFYYPDDISDWSPRGQIRNNYAYLAGEVLADFSFEPLVYGIVTYPDLTTANKTIIIPTLTDIQTSALPATREISSYYLRKVGVTRWVYDIELESTTGRVIKISSGTVEVKPEITV